MTNSDIKQMIKDVWVSGVYAHIEIDRQYDPSEIQQGIDETFEEYWESYGDKIKYKIVQE